MDRGQKLVALFLVGLLVGCNAVPAQGEEYEVLAGEPEVEGCVRPPLPGGALEQAVTAQAITATVVPILLIPVGSTVTAQQRNTLTQALGNVRRWYQRELPSKNVKWEPLQTLYGAKTASYYLTNNNVWNEIPGEIQASFGWNPWTYTGGAHRIALVIGRDLLGWAGGNGNSDGRGLAIAGMESLVEQTKCAGNWWCTQEIWHGTAIHELGHGFTLPHDTDPASIMSFHGDYTNKHFVSAHQTTVQASPATEAKQANWSYCGIDYQCATKRCGGNWSGDRLWCLPSSQYSKEAQNIPNGFTCRYGTQCTAGRCELNTNGDKVCSASALAAYVTPFFPDVP
jgi:hypothetical protein